MENIFVTKALRSRMAQLERENAEMLRMMERYSENILSDCLDGQDVFGDIPRIKDNLNHFPEARVQEMMDSFTTDRCCVIIVRVEDEAGSLMDRQQRTSLSEGDRGISLSDRLTRVLAPCCRSLRLRKNKNLVMVLNLLDDNQNEEDFIAQLSDLLKNEVEAVEWETGFLLYITVSDVLRGFQRLPAAYAQASKLMKYTDMFSERTSVFSLTDFRQQRHESLSQVPPDHVLGQLIKLLATSDYDGACELMLMTVTNYAMVDLDHVTHVRQYTEFLFSLAEAVCNVSTGENVPNWHAREDERRRFSSIETIQDDIIAFFAALAGSRQQTTVEAAVKMENVVKYIDEHYQEAELDVSALSRIFNLSLSHLSRSFKRDTGMNPLEYIQKVRVAAAKELLLDKDLTLTQVAEGVGYLSAWTLTRVFKKLENITPGQYRSAYGNK